MTRHRRILLVVVCILTAALPAADAEARGLGRALRGVRVAAAAAKVYGRLPSGEHMLTVSELASCIRAQRELEAMNSSLSLASAALLQEATRLEGLAATLSRDESRVDAYDGAAVEKYNSRLSSFKRAVRAYQALESEFNSDVLAHNSAGSAFDATCGGRSYYDDDYPRAAAQLVP